MSTPAKLDLEVDLFDDDDQKIFWRASRDIEHETFTQGAVGQAEHIALFKTPRFIVKFGDTGTFMFNNGLGLANSTLCESFTIKLANPRFRNVATSQTGSGGRPLRRRRPKNIFWAVCDIEHETFTQGAVGQAEHIALFKTPRFIVKFGDTGSFMFVSVMLYEEWSLFIVK
ncbi:hypothetical protein O0I10_006481 [Lichtheimia ornata]|uniref:Uncharacterized protein n=1 Tax=Lichtheimia ornata TaxID=688661 RepID=A0AAD7XYU3_9FUNG|nr:uncharacterized protein O0I10_006481 [Lichtheimia ornata]KAJ8657953.1 hypothetical protein O0I10_006481 [Lichtheimia ornata]